MTALTWYREASTVEASRLSFTGRRQARRQRRADEARAYFLARRFTAAASNLGLARDTQSCAGIPGLAVPVVVSVRLGDPDRLLVAMMPGQVPEDFTAAAAGLAESLGVHRVDIRRRSHGFVFVELQRVDRLDTPVRLPGPLAMADHALLLGGLDTGRDLHVRLSELAHVLVQGQTGSGKSRFLYGLFSQLSDAADVLICGSDITNLVLRPFARTRHGLLIATGAGDIEAHADVLEELAGIMDERIARIPDDLDEFPCTAADPYMLCLIEELPGLLRRAAQVDAAAPRGAVKLKDRIQLAYGRLVAEGRKAGFRLVMVMQRADATIIGGYERGQCPLKISFSVDDLAAIRMMHPAATDDVVALHVSALPGRALVSMPGLPVARLRSPEMGAYQDFRTNVLSPITAEEVTT
jgi:S-DNA-T family DNA segregation ATPase FtsK/SpoIIIE